MVEDNSLLNHTKITVGTIANVLIEIKNEHKVFRA